MVAARLLLLLAIPTITVAQTASTDTAPRMLTDVVTGDALWDTTTAQFEQKFGSLGLQWLSQSKDQARFFGTYALWSTELKIPELIAEFQEGRLVRVNASVFNRGDSAGAAADKEAFEKQVDGIKALITSNVGVQPTERGKDAQSAVKAMGWMWVKPPTAYLLEYSYVKEIKTRGQEFRPEFIRLRVAPVPKQQGLLATAQSGGSNQPVSKSSLSANVSREPN